MTEGPADWLDLALARFLSERAELPPDRKPAFESLIMTLSRRQQTGHNCLAIDDGAQALALASGLAARAGADRPLAPLIVDRNLLYLRRYWDYEQQLARRIHALLAAGRHYPFYLSDGDLQAALARYFSERDDQYRAAETALREPFCIITGGPGTGKTTTVVKILALMLEARDADPLRLALAAPTGKAAMRLQEAINANKQALPCRGSVRKRLPTAVQTLHTLLGATPLSPYYRYHADNPLGYDVVVVDEASMIDLALMCKLAQALKPDAGLILLGDKDQLASVEAGAVLADLSETRTLKKNVSKLATTYRFQGPIKQLADAVNRQQADSAWQLLQDRTPALQWLDGNPGQYGAERYRRYLQLVEDHAAFEDIHQAFSRFRILCANRRGPNGVTDLNGRVEHYLQTSRRLQRAGLWYVGRPVMILQNHPFLQLYNGDIGICLADPDNENELTVLFRKSDGTVKKVPPNRVPDCETAFAMTIHKSQGSEFEQVLIVLPERLNPVLNKELLYTAVTRAKQSLTVCARPNIFKETIRLKIERVTGLIQAVDGRGLIGAEN